MPNSLYAPKGLKLEPVEGRFYYGEGWSEITVTNNGKSKKHKLLYIQTVDISLNKNGKVESTRVQVQGVAGLPFSPSPLQVNSNVVTQPTTIKIKGFSNNELIPTSESASLIYFDINNSGLGEQSFNHAINVTWEFQNFGIFFEAEEITYLSIRPGAFIQFTKNGIKKEGIVEITTFHIVGLVIIALIIVGLCSWFLMKKLLDARKNTFLAKSRLSRAGGKKHKES